MLQFPCSLKPLGGAHSSGMARLRRVYKALGNQIESNPLFKHVTPRSTESSLKHVRKIIFERFSNTDFINSLDGVFNLLSLWSFFHLTSCGFLFWSAVCVCLEYAVITFLVIFECFHVLRDLRQLSFYSSDPFYIETVGKFFALL